MNLPCPRCSVELHHRSEGVYATSFCATCGGIFVSSKSEDAIGAAQSRESVELAKMLDAHPTHNAAEENAPAPCPMCAKIMEHAHVGALVIDRCQAHGAWYDKSELSLVIEVLSTRRLSADAKELGASPSGLELAREPTGRASRNAPQRRGESSAYAAASAIAGAQQESDRRERRNERLANAAYWGDDVGFFGSLLGGLFDVFD